MAAYYDTGTSTNTTTSSGTTWTSLYGHKVVHPKEMIKKRKAEVALRKKTVRNLPFVDGGDGLVRTLQREFDHWAGDQMRILHG